MDLYNGTMHTEELLIRYADLIKPHLELAKKAYGSRASVSPQHDASRAYTSFLCEYYEQGGSLLKMAERLGVTYASLHRRVTTPTDTRLKVRTSGSFDESEYDTAVQAILAMKTAGDTEAYHEELRRWYDQGYSLTRIAKKMGMSSSYPLYYGVNRTKVRSR